MVWALGNSDNEDDNVRGKQKVARAWLLDEEMEEGGFSGDRINGFDLEEGASSTARNRGLAVGLEMPGCKSRNADMTTASGLHEPRAMAVDT